MYVSFLYKQETVQGDSETSFHIIGLAVPARTVREASVAAFEQ